MPLSFPSNPTNGQTYTDGGRTWSWNGTTWKIVTGALIAGSVGTAELASGAVTTVKIADGAVTLSKVGPGIGGGLNTASEGAITVMDIGV